MIWSLFLRQKLVAFVNSENAADLVALTKMIEANELTVMVDRTFSLNETAKAIKYLQEGHARGKVAITV
jgi:NADPH:quinone reductase-like Zn-dependent oxidoreductase